MYRMRDLYASPERLPYVHPTVVEKARREREPNTGGIPLEIPLQIPPSTNIIPTRGARITPTDMNNDHTPPGSSPTVNQTILQL